MSKSLRLLVAVAVASLVAAPYALSGADLPEPAPATRPGPVPGGPVPGGVTGGQVYTIPANEQSAGPAPVKADAPAVEGAKPLPATIKVDPGKVVSHISPMIYGACLEDLNHEVYGGLYAQMIFGESFEEGPETGPPAGWSVWPTLNRRPMFAGLWADAGRGPVAHRVPRLQPGARRPHVRRRHGATASCGRASTTPTAGSAWACGSTRPITARDTASDSRAWRMNCRCGATRSGWRGRRSIPASSNGCPSPSKSTAATSPSPSPATTSRS